jgi:hypothetical protein
VSSGAIEIGETFGHPRSFAWRLAISIPMWLVMSSALLALPIAARSYFAFIISPVGFAGLTRTVWYIWLLAKNLRFDDFELIARTYLGRTVGIPWSEVKELQIYGDEMSFTEVRQVIRVCGSETSVLFTNKLDHYSHVMAELNRRLPDIPRRRPNLLARLLVAW